MAFAPNAIHGGASRIFAGVTPGATGTPPTYIVHTDGVPGSGTELGLTQGDTIFTYVPTKKTIDSEPNLAPVAAMTIAEMAQIETTVMEQTYFTLQRAFDTVGSESVAGGHGFWFGGGASIMATRTECIMVTARQRVASTRFIIAVLYKAFSVEGFKLSFKKSGESVYRILLTGLADTARNDGDRLGYFRIEL
jgi:hypothetical protein